MKTPCFIGCTVLAVLFFALGVLCLTFLPWFIKENVKRDFSLRDPATRFYRDFVNQSKHVAVYKVFNFWNVTNVAAVENGSAYPVVEKVGPIYYERIRIRVEDDIAWLANGTMQYKWRETWAFRADKSFPGADPHRDMIAGPRVGVYVAFQTVAARDFPWEKVAGFDLAVSLFLKSMYVTKSVQTLIDGYHDPFLDKIGKGSMLVGVAPAVPLGHHDEIYSGATPATNEPAVPDRSFGVYTMWNGSRDLSAFWTTPQTAQLRGTNGATYSPFLHDVPAITAFVEALKRPVILTHVADVTTLGVPCRRYSPRADQFVANDFNRGFGIFFTGFQPRPPIKEIAPSKLYTAITKQHFLDANTTDMHVVMDRAPDRTLDETQLEFEPHTAVLIRVRKRSMFTIKIGPVHYKNDFTKHEETLKCTQKVRPTRLPVFDETEAMDLPEADRDQIMGEVVWPMRLYAPVGGVLVGLAIVVELIALWRWCCGSGESEGKKKRGHGYLKQE